MLSLGSPCSRVRTHEASRVERACGVVSVVLEGNKRMPPFAVVKNRNSTMDAVTENQGRHRSLSCKDRQSDAINVVRIDSTSERCEPVDLSFY